MAQQGGCDQRDQGYKCARARTATGNLVTPQMLSEAVLAYLAVHPPSMRMVSPVIRDAAREARNTTTPATSIGSPIR